MRVRIGLCRTYFIYRQRVRRRRCGMQIEEESPKQYVDIARAPDKEMRPERLVPLGLRPGRSAAALPSSTISTYGLRRAPCIRSVLATTHHAPIYEIGSNQTAC